MRKLIAVFSLLSLFSCTSHRYHDGIYQASVFNANLNWVHIERLEIRGGNMTLKNISAVDNSITNEFKLACTQYPDKIEFKDKDGLLRVARVNADGNIKYGEYTYKRVSEDSVAIYEYKEKEPLIKKNDNGTITILPKNNIKSNTQVKVQNYGEVSYQYVENVESDNREVFFQGTRNFAGHVDDTYKVVISGSEIKIFDLGNLDSIIVNGTIKDGKILDVGGNESKFRYKKSILFYNGEPNQWYLFWEYN